MVLKCVLVVVRSRDARAVLPSPPARCTDSWNVRFVVKPMDDPRSRLLTPAGAAGDVDGLDMAELSVLSASPISRLSRDAMWSSGVRTARSREAEAPAPIFLRFDAIAQAAVGRIVPGRG